jgi:Zn-dependent peptidase ImmA (M78 family)
VVRRKHIRALAERLLEQHDVTAAPVSVADIASALGVHIQETPAEDDLSGFLYREGKKSVAVIGVNADHAPTRRNFTAAHELGHFLLHDFGDIHVDRQVWMRNEASSQGTNLEEKEANLFAAELLMPARFLTEDMEAIGPFDALDEQVIQNLADRYGVSTQAMTFRLTYLGYLKQ